MTYEVDFNSLGLIPRAVLFIFSVIYGLDYLYQNLDQKGILHDT